MSGRLAVFWLPRVLFWAALLVSLFLILAVILSPLLEGTDLLAQCGRIQAFLRGIPLCGGPRWPVPWACW